MKHSPGSHWRSSAGAIGLPWEFREHGNFLMEFCIFDHAESFKMLHQFFPQRHRSFLCKLVMTSYALRINRFAIDINCN